MHNPVLEFANDLIIQGAAAMEKINPKECRNNNFNLKQIYFLLNSGHIYSFLPVGEMVYSLIVCSLYGLKLKSYMICIETFLFSF